MKEKYVVLYAKAMDVNEGFFYGKYPKLDGKLLLQSMGCLKLGKKGVCKEGKI